MPFDFTRLNRIVGINRRNRDVISRRNPRHAFPLVDDKIKTKEVLSGVDVPFPETILVVKNFLQIAPTLERLQDHSSFVIKPARGRAGGGIVLIERDERGKAITPSGKYLSDEDLRRHMADILFGVYSFGRMDDTALVEKKIVPDPFFLELYPRGIPDIRIITLDSRPILGMLRIPTDRSDGKANLHQGAVGVAIDLETGTTAQSPPHPDTDAPLEGLTLPHWQGILDFAVRSSRAVPLGYVGVDLVIDRERGPLVLELNARPGLQIQVVNGRGLAPLIWREDGLQDPAGAGS